MSEAAAAGEPEREGEDAAPAGKERESESLDPLAHWYFAADGDPEALLSRSDDDPERTLRLLALSELAEQAFEAQARVKGADGDANRPGPGFRLGQYLFLQEIGSGGMGVLFLAEDLKLRRMVAVKLLGRPGQATAARFRREAEIAASLTHPNILPIYDHGDSNGLSWIAMRYSPGVDADRAVSRWREILSPHELQRAVATLAAKAARALQYAHELDVIHRDVKPSNILVEGHEPYLVDFGLALQLEDERLTQSGDLVGTVPYMSPEQVCGEGAAAGALSDVWSLGATLYHLLASTTPFHGKSNQSVARRILEADPSSLRRHGVSPDLEAVVFRALEKDLSRRYPSAAAMADDLERFVGGRPVQARHFGPLRRVCREIARRAVPLTILVTILGALGLAIASEWNARSSRSGRMKDRLAAAESSLERGDYEMAVERFSSLPADMPGREIGFLRARKHAIHETLMEKLFLSTLSGEVPSAGSRWAAEIDDLLRDAESVGHPEILGEHFRFLRLVALRNAHATLEADELIAEWEADVGRDRRRIVAVRLLAGSLSGVSGPVPSYRQIIEKLPLDAPLDHYFIGLALALVPGEAATARESLRAWVEGHPNDFWARLVIGNLCLEGGLPSEAREIFSSLIADERQRGEVQRLNQSKLAAAYYQRGLAEFAADEIGQALADFQEAARGHSSWRLHAAIARCRRRMGDPVAAIKDFEAALRGIGEAPADVGETKGMVSILKEMTRCETALGHFDAAEKIAARLRTCPDGNATFDLMKASILHERFMAEDGEGRVKDARQTSEELAELAHGHPEDDRIAALAVETEFYLANGRQQKAILERLDGCEEPSVWMRYARAYIRITYLLGQLDSSTIDPSAVRAADDLGYLQDFGVQKLQRLEVIGDRSGFEFLVGAARYFTGERATARAILMGLDDPQRNHQEPWRSLVGDLLSRLARQR